MQGSAGTVGAGAEANRRDFCSALALGSQGAALQGAQQWSIHGFPIPPVNVFPFRVPTSAFRGSLPFVCYLCFMEEIRLSPRQVIVQGASSTFSYPLSALSRCSYVLRILSQFVSYLLLLIREVRARLQCSILLLPSIICFLERSQSPQQMPAAPSCCGCSGLTASPWGLAIPRAVAAVQPWVMNATAQAAPHPAGRCAKGRLCSGVGKSGWRCPSTWHRAGAILEGSELSWGRSPNLPMVS